MAYMIEIYFLKQVKCPWSGGRIQKIGRLIGRKLNLKGGLEINIVGERTIRGLNYNYRGINEVTDVLSFVWQEDKVIKSRFLGQVYVCYPQIVRQAKQLRISVQEEFVRILVHGILHLAGYDHQTKKTAGRMLKLQEEAVANFY